MPHAPSTPRRLAAVALALAVVGTGCTVDELVGERSTPASTASEVPDGGGATDDAPAPDSAGDCDEDTTEALDATISGQLDAFRADDWERALEFSSSDFRAGFDPERFADVIEGSFPVAADEADHSLGACATDGDGAQVVVRVTDEAGDSVELLYLLVVEDGDWRIAGAAPHGDGSETEAPLV